MTAGLRKRIKIRTLKSKILLFFILFACIILLLQIGVFQKWIRSIIIEKSETYFKESVHQIGQRVDLEFNQFHAMAVGICNDQVVNNYLADLKKQSINYNIAKYKISNEILRTTNLDWIQNMYIFPVGGQPPINLYYSKAVFDVDANIQNMLNDAPGLTQGTIRWAEVSSEPGQVSAFLSIEEGDKYGILQISLSDTFFQFLKDVQLGSKGEVFLLKNNTVIYAKDHSRIGTSALAFDHKQSTTVKYELNESGWTLLGVVPQAEILQQIHEFNRIFIIMIIVILAAVMMFAVVSASIILRPLKQIIKGMDSIQQGNLDIRLEHRGNDEFSAIIFQFNYMVEQVNSLIKTVYQQQRRYREAEIVSLLSKLNPHFLYNSLDMIYWKAILKGEQEIGGSIVALSNILRYSISHHNEFVTVREDLNQLENYLTIQSMRFQDKLNYTFSIQPEIWDERIPKLVIQPLVENAIKYAFQNMKHDGHIVIRGYRSKNELRFEVADNGVGIPDERIRSIHSACEQDNTTEGCGLGIQLVHQRAKYLYGEGYGISIRSMVGAGTTITVRLGTRAIVRPRKVSGFET
ncbi:sensor histidine kinase [Paenibacillus frigoriresistens]|uniref:sensor histidine kinase n=1 Tax=Paenibacillus alginolyticus TaxID=59839 RepID=UPI001565234C|nr:histidine kinase [Paenibacillus frigoriresistens]NRF95862.1 sensor histidine kinase [Paenibacillus frigoriresistens]